MNRAYAVLVWVTFAFSSATKQTIGARRRFLSPPDGFWGATHGFSKRHSVGTRIVS